MVQKRPQVGAGCGLPVDIQRSLRRLRHSLAKDPVRWFHTAMNLWEGAEMLHRSVWGDPARHDDPVLRYRYWPIYAMLVGFAVENMLKGLAVAADSCLVKPSGLSTELRTHDLVRLWTLAGVQRLRSHQQTLVLMTQMVKAFGRYPVALKEDDMKGLLAAWTATEFDAMKRAWECVCKEGKTRQPEWPGWSNAA